MPKFVDNTVDLLVLVFEKIEDRILAGAFKFWFWLGTTLQITIHVPEPKPYVIYKDRPETQRTLVDLTNANTELIAERDSFESQALVLRAERDALEQANKQLVWALDGHHGVTTGPNRPNNNKKLTEREVFEIRNMKRQGWTNVQLAAAFDVNRATISRIVRGQYHKVAV